jgi:hypothetical protein
MGADWTAFFTGFFEETADQIEKRTAKNEKYEEDLREKIEASKAAMQKRKEVANIAKGIASRLKSNGVPEEAIRAAASSGPTGLRDLEAAWGNAEREYGVKAVRDNPSMFIGVDITPAGALMEGEDKLTTEQFIERTYGIAAPTTGSEKVPDRNLLQRIYGIGGKQAVRSRLDQEMAGMGYSALDIIEAAKAAEYSSVIPGAYVNYKSPKIFTPYKMGDEITEFNTIVSGMQRSDAYKDAVDAVDKAREAMANPINVDTDEKKAAAQAVLTRAQANLFNIREQFIGPYIRQQASAYEGNSYLDVMGDTVDAILGAPGFSKNLIGEAAQPDTQQAMPKASNAQATPEGITTSKLPPAGDIPVVSDWENNVVRTVTNTPHGDVAIVKKGDEEVVVLTRPRMQNGIMMPAGFPLPKETGDEIIKKYTTSTGPRVMPTSEEISTAAVQDQKLPITREEYKGMTRQERREAGLKESAIGSMLEGPFMGEFEAQSKAIKAGAGKDKYYAVKIPGVLGEKRVKGSDLSLIPDAYLEKETGAVVIREMEDGEKLKTWGPGRLKSAFKPGIAANPVTKGEEDKPATWADRERKPYVKKEKPSMEGVIPYGDIKPGQGYGVEAFGQGNIFTNGKQGDTLPIDKATDAFLRESSLDMLQYARAKGLTKDARPEEVLDAITQWAKENDVSLPAGKGAIIYAIKYGLGLR